MTTPNLSDILAAARRLEGVANRTPLLEYRDFEGQAGAILLVKFEGAQHEGSFKFRGAYNRLVQLDEDARSCGVVAWSSGNHAQGVAAAARRLSIAATIVMPYDAPAVKVQNTRRLGAEIVFYDRVNESREDIARAICATTGAILVPSYDDPAIIAGQGTVGLEIVDQAKTMGHKIDQLLVCCGGGGLVAGTAIAVAGSNAPFAVYSVEPAAFDDTARSLESGVRERVQAGAKSICDALLAPKPGELTFPINQRLVAGGLSVTDDEVRCAMVFAFSRLKIVIEPGGAVALAAALSGKVETAGRTTAVVVSGGNVDPAMLAEMLTAANDETEVRGC